MDQKHLPARAALALVRRRACITLIGGGVLFWMHTATPLPESGISAKPSTMVQYVWPVVQVFGAGGSTATNVTEKMQLHDGDYLAGESDRSSVQVDCPNGGTQTLKGGIDGKFAAVIHNGCILDLTDGMAIATTGLGGSVTTPDGPATINGPGAVSMLSSHTQFGLVVKKVHGSWTTEGLVFDGSAVLNRPGVACRYPVSAGLSVDTDTCEITGIRPEEYDAVATAYTDLDLSQAKPNAGAADRKTLHDRWLGALKDPRDAEARVELAELEGRIGATKSQIFTYELRRAAVLARTSGRADLTKRVDVLAIRFGVVIAPPPQMPAPPVNLSSGKPVPPRNSPSKKKGPPAAPSAPVVSVSP